MHSVPPAPPFRPELLEANLAALDAASPALAERVRWPVSSDHVRFEDGDALLVRHRAETRLEPDASALEAALAPAAGADEVLLLGLGTGALLERLLESGKTVLAWERDPWLLRLNLMRRDLADAITRGRCLLALGVDLLDVEADGAARVEHPLLARLYAREIAFLGVRSPGRVALVGDGGLLVDGLAAALERAGFLAWRVSTERLSREELTLTAERLSPLLTAAINYTEGLNEFCAANALPLVIWEIDPVAAPPRSNTASTAGTWIFTWREANLASWREAGYANVEHLPLASDPDARAPLDDAERARFEAPISFVGSSLVENARTLERRFLFLYGAWKGVEAIAEAKAALREVLAAQRTSFERFRVPELLEERLPGFTEWARTEIDAAVLVGESSASEKRLSALANLGALGPHVWGDEGWRTVERFGVRWRGPAGHQHELTRVYNATTVNVDVGRLYQQDIVTMRVFDVLACGAFVLAEHSEALASLFDVGVEIDSWSTFDELRAKAEHWAARPTEARALAARGRERVLAEHTIDLRVGHMLRRVGLAGVTA